MHTAAELKTELEQGTETSWKDLNPLKLFRQRNEGLHREKSSVAAFYRHATICFRWDCSRAASRRSDRQFIFIAAALVTLVLAILLGSLFGGAPERSDLRQWLALEQPMLTNVRICHAPRALLRRPRLLILSGLSVYSQPAEQSHRKQDRRVTINAATLDFSLCSPSFSLPKKL